MKLKRFCVHNFRNIVDSGWIEIDDIITLVGKNESGKTSLLKALWKFNPSKENPYNLDREWPRDRPIEQSSEQIVIETEFQFDEEERASLAEIDNSVASVTGVNIDKNYQGNFLYKFLPSQPAGSDDIEWAVSVIKDKIGELSVEASDHFKKEYRPAFDQFIEEIRKNGGSAYAIENFSEFKAKYETFYDPNESEDNPQFQADQQAIVALDTAADAAVEELTYPPLQRVIDTVRKWLPTFIYMDDYRIFTGTAHLDEVQQRLNEGQPTDQDYTIRLIMKQAGLDLDEEVKRGNAPDREQRMLGMNNAGLTLTKKIAHRWSQKRYEIRFEADGQQLIMFVKDADSPALVPLEQRSKGFQWFFSFDMLFMSETKGNFRNSVILLDEPGLHLHAAAQRDLLERMRAYSKANQLIYSTHLPFMVDSTRFDNIYICEEQPKDGVTVHKNWVSAGQDARFTIQAALGLLWSQSLFVGKYNLVVEGVTDFWFLSTFSELLRQAGKEGLDEELVITPAGGASKVAYIGTILHGQKLHVAVLLDSDPAGQRAYEELVHKWILQDKYVLMLDPEPAIDGERCLEDMFTDDYYLGFVHEAYEKELKELGKEKLMLDNNSGPIIQRIESSLKDAGIKVFNKGRVAKRIMKDLSGKSVEDLPSDTVNNFANVIAKVNRLVAEWRKEEQSM